MVATSKAPKSQEIKTEFNPLKSKTAVETLTKNVENCVNATDKNTYFPKQNVQKKVLITVKRESTETTETFGTSNGINADLFDQDKTYLSIGYPSLTSTPMCIPSREQPPLSAVAMPDLSIISREGTQFNLNDSPTNKECPHSLPTLSPTMVATGFNEKPRNELLNLKSNDIIIVKTEKGSPPRLRTKLSRYKQKTKFATFES